MIDTGPAVSARGSHEGARTGWTTTPPAGLARWLAGLVPFRRGRSWTVRAFRPDRDATVAFRPGRAGLDLRCQSGLFLVTQEGDPDDHVLAAGDSFRTASRGRVVAWAFEAGVLVGPGRR